MRIIQQCCFSKWEPQMRFKHSFTTQRRLYIQCPTLDVRAKHVVFENLRVKLAAYLIIGVLLMLVEGWWKVCIQHINVWWPLKRVASPRGGTRFINFFAIYRPYKVQVASTLSTCAVTSCRQPMLRSIQWPNWLTLSYDLHPAYSSAWFSNYVWRPACRGASYVAQNARRAFRKNWTYPNGKGVVHSRVREASKHANLKCKRWNRAR